MRSYELGVSTRSVCAIPRDRGFSIITVAGNRNEGFSTTREYFEYINAQDWQQLRRQPNSIAGPRSAKERYTALKVLESLIPGLINPLYDRGPFKLICDDLGPANMIVRSKDDLTTTGLVDLEWVYAGPAQLFGSAPWWLLLDRPVHEDWDFEGDEAPTTTHRYFSCLSVFRRVLAEEEAKMTQNRGNELSGLIQWSEDSGAMWLHMLLSSGFFDSPSFPCMQLWKHLDVEWWDERTHEYGAADEVETFVTNKLDDLAAYDKVKDEVEQNKALMDSRGLYSRSFLSP